MNHPRLVLVVEDDPKTARLLSKYLLAEQFEPHVLDKGSAVVPFVRERMPSAILLDLNLPELDGVEVCRELRKFSSTPIIMLTARVDEIDRLLGFDIGADDYVSKPFSPKEVMARVRAVIRRAEGRTTLAGKEGWTIDEGKRLVGFAGEWLTLTDVEYRLMTAFLRKPEHLLSRDQLLDRAHADFRNVSDRSIDVHIKNLRKKIAAVTDAKCIASVYGLGYRFSTKE